MANERSVDEHLGFARKPVKHEPESPHAHPAAHHRGARDAGTHDPGAPDADAAGAYEDSWYQVLKAKAEESEEDADD